AGEIGREVSRLRADIVICDDELKPSQQRTLEEITGIPVVDRSAVILDIFAKHARSREGRIQVELAQLEYRLPRLTGRGKEMSRLGGGIGTRGPADVLPAGRPFPPLGRRTRRAAVSGGATRLMSDTVGFVNKLPPTLVAAFRATLAELAYADVRVHVADVTHPNLHEHIRVVDET